MDSLIQNFKWNFESAASLSPFKSPSEPQQHLLYTFVRLNHPEQGFEYQASQFF